MFRNSHIPRGLSVNAKNSTRRWRRVLIALALALTIGGAGQSPAQAAPARQGFERFVFYLVSSAAGDLNHICIGEPVVINIKAERLQANARSLPDMWTNPPVQVFGVTLNGSVANPNYGTLTPASQVTSAGSTPPGSAVFTFTPKNPGTTEIIFKGTQIENRWFALLLFVSDRDYLSTTLDVTVVDCNYEVTAISHWSGLGYNYVATIDQARMTAEAPGHYRGTATVNWVITEVHPRVGCRPEFTSTSQADLTGEMDADGQQLVVDVAYQLAEVNTQTFLDDCTTASSTALNKYTPDPLTLSVDASGGFHMLSQAIVHQLFPAMNMSGSADVFVLRGTKP